MKKVLVTGGTVFVSRYVAEYYVKKGYQVYVLNRNRHIQPRGVTVIEADRNSPGDRLRNYHFDVIFDITARTAGEVEALLHAVGSYDDYIFISSSAVYPEHGMQPFHENTPLGENKFWGSYGTDKIHAEQLLVAESPDAYILRPPYLYGPMNNVYQEAFVFECALENRVFFLPQNGQMKLQFFYIDDLCRFMDIILKKKPDCHIYNVGNRESISVRDWVTACYETAGTAVRFAAVDSSIEQRNYFSFYDYEYSLDISRRELLMPETRPLTEGLKEAFAWYQSNAGAVDKREYIKYIDENLAVS